MFLVLQERKVEEQKENHQNLIRSQKTPQVVYSLNKSSYLTVAKKKSRLKLKQNGDAWFCYVTFTEPERLLVYD